MWVKIRNPVAWFQGVFAAVVFQLFLPGATTFAQSQPIIGEIDNYLLEQIRSSGIPGLAVAVVRDGDVVFSRAYGVSGLGTDDKLTPKHIFHFASISKPFVATAIVQLAEKGKLGLDDTVVKHLPYFRLDDERYRDITIRQMLNHTAGMPDVEDYVWGHPQFDEEAAERYVRSLSAERLLWDPGSGFKYSNMAFDVLGDLIAKVSGVSFEEYIRINILDPIGMVESSFIYPQIDQALRTTGHTGNPARVSAVYPYNRRHAPSSTLNSSVAEMTRWMLVNLNRGELDGRRILREESFDLLWTSTTDHTIGLSWFIHEEDGDWEILHGGSDLGFRSYIVLLPEDGIGVVLASNWQRTDAEEIIYGVVDLIFPPEAAHRGTIDNEAPN
jgi:CubicO group peptidase (beta-lactamase class C family)